MANNVDDNKRLIICLGIALFGTVFVLLCYVGVAASPSPHLDTQELKQEHAFLKHDGKFGENDKIKEEWTAKDNNDNLEQNWKNLIEAKVANLDHQLIAQTSTTEDELDSIENSVTDLENGQFEIKENVTTILKTLAELEEKIGLQLMALSKNLSSKVELLLDNLMKKQDEKMLILENKYAGLKVEENLANQTIQQRKIELHRGGGCSPSSLFVKRKSSLVSNLTIIGTHGNGSIYYGCRAKVSGNNVVFGTYNLQQETCYVAWQGSEWVEKEVEDSDNGHTIEVLTNPQNSTLSWKEVHPVNYFGQEWFEQEGVVVGGRMDGVDLFIVRCRHQAHPNDVAWIPGWFHADWAPVYSFGGEEHFCKAGNVEALVCRSDG